MFATQKDELIFLARFIARINAKGWVIVEKNTLQLEGMSPILIDAGYDFDAAWDIDLDDAYDAEYDAYSGPKNRSKRALIPPSESESPSQMS